MTIQALLAELVACPSITPTDAEAQTVAQAPLCEADFRISDRTFGQTRNTWAVHGEGAPLVVLAGHTDVVPPGPIEAWITDPFEPSVRDGRLYGRGAVDMKASVACMVLAAAELAQAGHPGTIGILLTGDEEGPGYDGTDRVLAHLLAEGVRIDAAIVGEPTSEQTLGDALKVGRRGSLTAKVHVAGVQGHVAYPEQGENAVHRLAPFLAELVEREWDDGDENFPPTGMQVTFLRAGAGANNVIPGEVQLRFNFRYSPSAPDLAAEVEAMARRHRLDARFAWSRSADPFLVPPGPITDALSAAIQRTTGLTPRFSTAGGSSDARFFAARGIPVAEFGPVGTSMHQANEWVELAPLENLRRIYRDATATLLGA